MIFNQCFKIRNFILAAAVIAGLSLGAHATAQERPFLVDLNSRTVTEIGTLGGSRTVASAINDAGQVAGYSITSEFDWHAFVTGPSGKGMRDLGTLGGGFSQAYGINDAGQIVGQSDKARGSRFLYGFITGPDGREMRELPTSVGADVHPAGINNAGQVGGWLVTTGGDRHAFITGPNGMGMRDLGSYIYVSAINDAGQLVGGSSTDVEAHAFITGPDGVGIRKFGGNSWAYAINDTGQVAGVSANHAFITESDGMGMRDIGTLGGAESSAFGINDAGQVVGSSATSNRVGVLEDQHAFITGPDGMGMTDLNSLVDLPQGWILTNAMDINNNGQVIAAGIVPEPEAYALMLAGLGLLAFMVRRKMAENPDESGHAF